MSAVRYPNTDTVRYPVISEDDVSVEDDFGGGIISTIYTRLKLALFARTILFVYAALFVLIYFDNRDDDPFKKLIQRLIDDYKLNIFQVILDNYKSILFFMCYSAFHYETSRSGDAVFLPEKEVYVLRQVRPMVYPAVWGLVLFAIYGFTTSNEAFFFTVVANLVSLFDCLPCYFGYCAFTFYTSSQQNDTQATTPSPAD